MRVFSEKNVFVGVQDPIVAISSSIEKVLKDNNDYSITKRALLETVNLLKMKANNNEKKVLISIVDLLSSEKKDTEKESILFAVADNNTDNRINLLSKIAKMNDEKSGERIETLNRVVELLNDKSKADALKNMVTMLDKLKIQVEFSETDQAKDTGNKTSKTDLTENTVFDKRYQVNMSLNCSEESSRDKPKEGQTEEQIAKKEQESSNE